MARGIDPSPSELKGIWERDESRTPWAWNLRREMLAKRLYDNLYKDGPSWRSLAYKTRNRFRSQAQVAKAFYMDVLEGDEP